MNIIVYVAHILIFLKCNFKLPKSHKFLTCLPHLFHYSPFPSLAVVLCLCMCVHVCAYTRTNIYYSFLTPWGAHIIYSAPSSLKTSVCVSLKQENSVTYPNTTIKIRKPARREGCPPSLLEFPQSPHQYILLLLSGPESNPLSCIAHLLQSSSIWNHSISCP